MIYIIHMYNIQYHYRIIFYFFVWYLIIANTLIAWTNEQIKKSSDQGFRSKHGVFSLQKRIQISADQFILVSFSSDSSIHLSQIDPWLYIYTSKSHKMPLKDRWKTLEKTLDSIGNPKENPCHSLAMGPQK